MLIPAAPAFVPPVITPPVAPGLPGLSPPGAPMPTPPGWPDWLPPPGDVIPDPFPGLPGWDQPNAPDRDPPPWPPTHGYPGFIPEGEIPIAGPVSWTASEPAGDSAYRNSENKCVKGADPKSRSYSSTWSKAEDFGIRASQGRQEECGVQWYGVNWGSKTNQGSGVYLLWKSRTHDKVTVTVPTRITFSPAPGNENPTRPAPEVFPPGDPPGGNPEPTPKPPPVIPEFPPPGTDPQPQPPPLPLPQPDPQPPQPAPPETEPVPPPGTPDKPPIAPPAPIPPPGTKPDAPPIAPPVPSPSPPPVPNPDPAPPGQPDPAPPETEPENPPDEQNPPDLPGLPVLPEGPNRPPADQRPPTRPPGTESTPDGDVGQPGQAPDATLEGIAQEVGKIEQKVLKLMQRPQPDFGDLIDLIQLLLTLLQTPVSEGEWTLTEPCPPKPGDPPVVRAVEYPGGGSILEAVLNMQRAMGPLMQAHLDSKVVTCPTARAQGQPVTVTFDAIDNL